MARKPRRDGAVRERRGDPPQAASEVARIRAHLAAIVESSDDAIVSKDLNGIIASWNRGAERIFGYTADEVIGKPVTILMPPERVAEEPGILERVRRGQRVEHYETVRRRKDGALIDVSLSVSPVRDGNGRVVGASKIARDITEQKRAEALIRKRAGELAAIYEQAPVGLCVLDRRLRFVQINARLAEMDGASVDAHVGHAVSEVVPALGDTIEGIAGEVFRTGRPLRDVEVVGETPAAPGRRRVFISHWFPLVLNDEIIGVSVVVEEITKRREAEREREELLRERERNAAALRESERRWRTLAEALPNLVWTALPDGRCDWLSSQWGRYAGIPERELLGLAWLERTIHPEDRERTLACWRAACEDRRDYDLEYRIRRHDGEYRWFKTRGVPIRDEDGGIVYWFGTCTDIEDVKQADARERRLVERALAATAKFEAVFNQSGIFAGVMDLAGNLREVNDLALVACGYAREEVLGRPFWETPWWRGSDEVKARIRAATAEAAAGAAFREELRYWLADGSERIVDFAMHPIRDASGAVIFLHPTGIDVTEQRKVEDALRAADRRKDEFLAMLGHELRNPLAAIRNAVATASLDADHRHEALTIARRQIEQLGHLVDDLLDVARITQGRIGLRRAPIVLQSVVERAVEANRPQREANGHALAVDVPRDAIVVDGDAVRLEQVLVNLLSNACKYTNRRGRIRVVVSACGGEAVVRVRDSGIGIAPDVLPRVFELFGQAERSLDRAQGGLGIGLTIAQRIVELHGGRIEAFSEGLGRGAEFAVRLPVADASRLHDALAASAAPPEEKRTSRVLMVEDNPDAAESLRLLLEVLGHQVRVAHGGVEALEAARANRPEVMLVDIGLPGMDGYEVARRVRSEPSLAGVTLVALTGYGRDEDKHAALAAGFDYHLVKPVDPDNLERLIRDLGSRAGAGRAAVH